MFREWGLERGRGHQVGQTMRSGFKTNHVNIQIDILRRTERERRKKKEKREKKVQKLHSLQLGLGSSFFESDGSGGQSRRVALLDLGGYKIEKKALIKTNKNR